MTHTGREGGKEQSASTIQRRREKEVKRGGKENRGQEGAGEQRPGLCQARAWLGDWWWWWWGVCTGVGGPFGRGENPVLGLMLPLGSCQASAIPAAITGAAPASGPCTQISQGSPRAQSGVARAYPATHTHGSGCPGTKGIQQAGPWREATPRMAHHLLPKPTSHLPWIQTTKASSMASRPPGLPPVHGFLWVGGLSKRQM